MWTAVALGLGGLFSGILGSALIYRFGHRLTLVDVPNERSSHCSPTPRGAGAGVWAFFVIASALVLGNWPLALTGGAFGLFGLLEDRLSFSSKSRLIVHLALASLMVLLWAGPPESAQAAALFTFWAVFIASTANFYNFMDGINGMAGLTGAVAFALLSFFSYFIAGRPDIALMGVALTGGCLGFLPFNIPGAKVFLGDTGSLFLGFIFAALTVQLSTSLAVLVCLAMFLCTFYADALRTIFDRIKKRENLMASHRSHLYQHLCNESKIPHWKVSLLYASIQLVFGVLSIIAYYLGNQALQGLVAGVFAVCFLAFYVQARKTGTSQGDFLKNLLQPSKIKKVMLFLLLDVLITVVSLYLSFLLRFDLVFPPQYMGLFAVSLPFFVVLRLIVFAW
ncbi:MAG: hypothetical protein HY891_02305, partial [Deltaproteobacteria bacterium]|nr:hypothetical protein [Deltaproteobacteria bacterium]